MADAASDAPPTDAPRPTGSRVRRWYARRGPRTQRALRRLLILGVVVAILQPIVGFLLVPWIAERIVVPRIARSLDGDLSVTEVYFNPYTWYLRIDGIVLTDPEGQLAAGCTTAEVDFNPLSSLVLPGWRFNDIVLTDPSIDAIHAPELGLNIARILRGPTPADGATPDEDDEDDEDGFRIPRLIIGGFEIRNGRATLDDRTFPSPVRSHVAGVSFRVEDLDTTPTAGGSGREPMHRFQATTESGATIEWTGTLSLDPPVSKGVLLVSDLALPNVAAYATRYTDATVRAGEATILANYILAPTERPAPAPEEEGNGKPTVDTAAPPPPPLPPVVRASIARASLRDVEILRPEGTFATLPSVEVEGMEVDALARTMLVTRVAIEGGALRIDRDAEGRLNLLRMIRPSEDGAPAATPSAGSPAKPAKRTADRKTLQRIADPTQQFVTSLSFLLDDLLGGSDGWSVALEECIGSGLTIVAEDRSTDEPVRATLAETRFTAGPIRTAEGFVVPFDASLTLNGTPSAARGTLAVPSRTLDVALSTEGLDLRPFAPYLRLVPIDPLPRSTLDEGLLRARGSLRVATPSVDQIDAAWNGLLALDRLAARVRGDADTATDARLLELDDAEWSGEVAAAVRLTREGASVAGRVEGRAAGVLSAERIACGRATLVTLGFDDGTAESGRARWEGDLAFEHTLRPPEPGASGQPAPPDDGAASVESWVARATGRATVEAARTDRIALGVDGDRATRVDGSLATATIDGTATLRRMLPRSLATTAGEADIPAEWSLTWKGGAGIERGDLRVEGPTPLAGRAERLSLQGEATLGLGLGIGVGGTKAPALSVLWEGDASIGAASGEARVSADASSNDGGVAAPNRQLDRQLDRQLWAAIDEAVVAGRMTLEHTPTRPIAMRWKASSSTMRLAVRDGPAPEGSPRATLPTRALSHGSARFDGDFALTLEEDGRVALALTGVATMETPAIGQTIGAGPGTPDGGERIDLAAASARFDGSIESDIRAARIAVTSAATIALTAPRVREAPAGATNADRLALDAQSVELTGNVSIGLEERERSIRFNGSLAPRGLAVSARTEEGPIAVDLAEGALDGTVELAMRSDGQAAPSDTAISVTVDLTPAMRGVAARQDAERPVSLGVASIEGRVKGSATMLLVPAASGVDEVREASSTLELSVAIADATVQKEHRGALGALTVDGSLQMGLARDAASGGAARSANAAFAGVVVATRASAAADLAGPIAVACERIRYEGSVAATEHATGPMVSSEGTLVLEAIEAREVAPASPTASPTASPSGLRIPRVEVASLAVHSDERVLEAALLAIDGAELERSLDGAGTTAADGDPDGGRRLRARIQAFLEGRDEDGAAGEPSAWALRVGELRLKDGVVRLRGTADGADTGGASEVTIDQLAVTLRNISSDGDAAPAAPSGIPTSDPALDLSARLVGSSHVTITGNLDPFARPVVADLVLAIRDMPLPPIDPLSARAVGWRMQAGRLSTRIPVVVDRGQVRGTLDFTLDNPVVGDRSKAPGAPSLPLDFALAVMRDTNNQVKGTIPFTGDATDPSFSLGGLIVQVILNFIGKIATAPFQLLASALAGSGEVDLSTIPFDPGSDTIGSEGLRRIDLLAKALNERPGLALTVRGAVAAAADERAQRLALLRAIVAKRASNLAGARGSLDQATYRWLVGVLYAELPNAKDSGDAPQPAFEAMEDALLATVAWEPSMLDALRQRRADAVVAALRGGGVAVDRVQALQDEPEAPAPDGGAADAPRAIIELTIDQASEDAPTAPAAPTANADGPS